MDSSPGKYKPGQREVAGTRSAEGWAWHGRFFAANADETLAALLEVAEELGKTPAQVALRWVLEQPGVSSVIAGRAQHGATARQRRRDGLDVWKATHWNA